MNCKQSSLCAIYTPAPLSPTNNNFMTEQYMNDVCFNQNPDVKLGSPLSLCAVNSHVILL